MGAKQTCPLAPLYVCFGQLGCKKQTGRKPPNCGRSESGDGRLKAAVAEIMVLVVMMTGIGREAAIYLRRKNKARQPGPSIHPEGHTPRPFQLLPVIHWRKYKKMLASSIVGLTCRRAA